MKEFIPIITITMTIVFMVKILSVIFKKDYGYIIKKPSKLPGFPYKLFYSDEKNVTRKEDVIYSRLLKSKKYDIQGKPDFIYKKNNRLIPVELKSGDIKDDGKMPHHGDLMQLAAYFIIIEESFHIRPKEGKIVYNDYMFIIENTKTIRGELIHTVEEMRQILENPNILPEPEYVKCRYCICRGTVCEFCEF